MFTQKELETYLEEQIQFLRASCKSFDLGFEAESKRLAVIVRVLVHDTNNSRSLLGQLGIKKIPFYSTAPSWNPNNILVHHGLIQVGFENGNPLYRAPLDDRFPNFLRWIKFDEWWTEIVFDDRKSNTLTRKDIVLGLANKEGGAHVDSNLTPAYEAIIKHNSFWQIETPNGEKSLPGRIELLSMRQIAHEILRTLEKTGLSN